MKQFGVSTEISVLVPTVQNLLQSIHDELLSQATSFRDANIVDVASYDELKAAVAEGKWARGGWKGADADETRVKDETGATLRCFPLEQPPGPHVCLMTGKVAEEVAIFAKAY